jgi:hypothetical protein
MTAMLLSRASDTSGGGSNTFLDLSCGTSLSFTVRRGVLHVEYWASSEAFWRSTSDDESDQSGLQMPCQTLGMTL